MGVQHITGVTLARARVSSVLLGSGEVRGEARGEVAEVGEARLGGD